MDALAKIMGHSDLDTLRRYLAIVEQDLADAHKRHGAWITCCKRLGYTEPKVATQDGGSAQTAALGSVATREEDGKSR